MRKSVLLLASMVLAVLLVCGVALAATISCPTGARGLCVGTAEDDTLRGTDGSDDIRGAGGNDVLNAKGEKDMLSGNVGDDVLCGGAGNDTYLLSVNHGRDRIPDGGEGGGVDTINFSAKHLRVSAWLSRGSARLVRRGPTGHEEENSSIEWHPSPVIIENVRGGAQHDQIFGNNRPNSLSGRAGVDRLRGGKGDDFLYGGEGNDYFYGGTFRTADTDTMEGGSGADTYYFEQSPWGNDTIVDTTPSDLSDVSAGNEVVFQGGVTIDLVSSADKPEVIHAGSGSTVNWSGNAVTNVHTRGSSDVTGNPDANQILESGFGGSTISTGAGDDVINVVTAGDWRPGDYVDCGEDGPDIIDNDTVYFDPADTVINCETLNP